MAGACAPQPWPEPPPVDQTTFLTEHAAWHAKVQQRERDEFVGLAGLWPLTAGRTPFGTDSSLPIVLPGPGPRGIVGAFVRRGGIVQLEPASPYRIFSDAHRLLVTTLALRTDEDSLPTYLRFGSLRLWIHLEGERAYVRAYDFASPYLTAFAPAPEYEPDPRWRVAARFDAYQQPRAFRVADVAGGEQRETVPGELVFRVAGRRFRLQAFATPGNTRLGDSRTLWLMFRDSTNLRATYGAGRYLWVPLPDSTGWTTIDFTRAISPPCAFTAFATCPLPPRENTLAVSIAAGEKRSH